MPLKVGSIGYATHQGLGYLLKSFRDAGVVTHPVIVLNGRPSNHVAWYPDSPVISSLRREEEIERIREVCRSVDVMLFFETPFIWQLIPYCRDHGVKTVLMPMYECEPNPLPYVPDAFLNPSPMEQAIYRDGTYIPVPIEDEFQPTVRRTAVETFVHNSGHGGLQGRNGTAELISALQHTKAPFKLIIRAQSKDVGPIDKLDKRVTLIKGTVSREDLYRVGDVFVFPDKFNGLSLPIQEAAASGMALAITNRFPATVQYPEYIPIQPTGFVPTVVFRGFQKVDSAIVDPRTIAEVLENTYGTDVSRYSNAGAEWVRQRRWSELRPRYVEFLERVVSNG
jgi:glycosyltransferase involved in cell wall biosynthesis